MKRIYKYWFVYDFFLLINQFVIFIYDFASIVMASIMMFETTDFLSSSNKNIDGALSAIIKAFKLSFNLSEVALLLMVITAIFMILLRLAIEKGYTNNIEDNDMRESIINTIGIVSNNSSSFVTYKYRSGFLLGMSILLLAAVNRSYNFTENLTSVEFSTIFFRFYYYENMTFTVIFVDFICLLIISVLYGEIVTYQADKLDKAFGKIDGGIYRDKFKKKMRSK